MYVCDSASVSSLDTDLLMGPKLIAQGRKSNRANGVETHGALSFYIHNISNVNGHSDLC